MVMCVCVCVCVCVDGFGCVKGLYDQKTGDVCWKPVVLKYGLDLLQQVCLLPH